MVHTPLLGARSERFGKDEMHTPDPEDTAHTPLLGPDVKYVLYRFFKSFVFLYELVMKRGNRRNHLPSILFMFLDFPHPYNGRTCKTKLKTKQLHFWDTPSYRGCFTGQN